MNIVPTPATRKLARFALNAARKDSGPDATLQWLPEVQYDQLGAFVGLILSAAAANPAADIPRHDPDQPPPPPDPNACRSCDGDRGVNPAARGLCRKCYDSHRAAGTLVNFQPVQRHKQARAPEPCATDGCKRPATGRGLCSSHRAMTWRKGLAS